MRTDRGEAAIAFAALDFLSALLLAVYVLIAPHAAKPSTVTRGAYAVVLTWPESSNDDLDLYVQDPAGHVVWWNAREGGAMHLEHDDLGLMISGPVPGSSVRQERVVIQTAQAGEYVTGVHEYDKRDPGPTHATVALYRLDGGFAEITERRVTLRANGDWRTGFRFVVDGRGRVRSINHLPKVLARS